MTLAVMSRGAMTFERSVLAQVPLHESTLGRAHAYARGSDQFREHVTPIPVRAHAVRVEDTDGNWLGALQPVKLGRGSDPLVTAVHKHRAARESIPERSRSAARSVLIVGRAAAAAIREFPAL
jgi:hypothetical protein